MAHKTLIGGTAYEIAGGRTLVNGTGYDIGKGRTLVGGTGYDISFGGAVILTGTWDTCYAEVDSVQYNTPQELKVPKGGVIKLHATTSNKMYPCEVRLNGTMVAKSDNALFVDYEYTVIGNCTINCRTDSNNAMATRYFIEITEE